MSHSGFSGQREWVVCTDISKTQKFKEIHIYIYIYTSNIFMEIKNQRLLVSPFALDQAHLPQRTKKGPSCRSSILLRTIPPSGETSSEDSEGKELE